MLETMNLFKFRTNVVAALMALPFMTICLNVLVFEITGSYHIGHNLSVGQVGEKVSETYFS